MTNWITKNDFHPYRYLAVSIQSDQLLDQSITEAMLFDVQKWLGKPLFYDLCTKFDATQSSPPESLPSNYAKLLDGGDYEYCGQTIAFQGLKACLVYYAFARYTNRDGVKYTAGGIVTKTTDLSEPVTDKTRLRLATDDYALAEALKLEIIDFLNRNTDDFEHWRCTRKARRANFKIVGD